MLTIAGFFLYLLRPCTPIEILRSVDWETIGALAGLLLLTKGIEISGVLQKVAKLLLGRVSTLRLAALSLCSASILLSAFLTNDVCLFLLVPLTRELCSQANLPLARLVALEALSVNIGSAITPIGNPQNLFLWQRSGMGFINFAAMMMPAAIIMTVLLIVTVLVTVSPLPVVLRSEAEPFKSSRRTLWLSAGLFIPFVIALNVHQWFLGLLIVASAFAFFEKSVLIKADWTLLLIIGLMFFDMRQLASLPIMADLLSDLPIQTGVSGYLAAVLVSQGVSNVPAAILLAPYIHDTRALVAGVSIGGFGFFIGSLANLIALRLSDAPNGLAALHRISFPFLLISGLAVGLWIYVG